MNKPVIIWEVDSTNTPGSARNNALNELAKALLLPPSGNGINRHQWATRTLTDYSPKIEHGPMVVAPQGCPSVYWIMLEFPDYQVFVYRSNGLDMDFSPDESMVDQLKRRADRLVLDYDEISALTHYKGFDHVYRHKMWRDTLARVLLGVGKNA